MNVKLFSENAKMPTRAHESDAGYDLYTPESFVLHHGERMTIKLGVGFDIVENWVGLIMSRSSLGMKYGVVVTSEVIDSGYKGEISAVLINTGDKSIPFEKHDRVAQIIFTCAHTPKLELVNLLNESDRGTSGFGSTGK